MRSELEKIIGKENVSNDAKKLSEFAPPGKTISRMILVAPENTAEVQAIVRLAAEKKVPLFTVNDRYLPTEDIDKEGILFSFKRMNRILQIDPRNLCATVQRGVSFAQLMAELPKHGVKLSTPVFAGTDSVVQSAMNREPIKSQTRYPFTWVTNLEVVLADGQVQLTGTQALDSHKGSSLLSDAQANYSRWYVGSEDIFGIVTRATVHIFMPLEKRACLAYAFPDAATLKKAVKEIPRRELNRECAAINRQKLKSLLPDVAAPGEWILLLGCEARAARVDYQLRKIQELMSCYQGQPAPELNEAGTALLERVWPQASHHRTSWFCLPERYPALDQEVEKTAKKMKASLGKTLMAVDRGRTFFAGYDFLDSNTDLSGEIESLNERLMEQGAYFDRPLGRLAEIAYRRMPNFLPVLKKIKDFMDPQNLCNPGRLIPADTVPYAPLPVGGSEGDAIGITVKNLNAVKEKLTEIVGAQWVSDNPADLNCYSRDFTVFSGERPNLVVLPGATDEVQKIVALAYAHGIPLVPMSTGFNHAGLAVTRKGGIMLDLKRMNRLRDLDTESMTASIEPGVRMRSLFREAIKYSCVEGFHLKPALPLTLGSISFLSNLISRGGPGCAVKYGFGPDSLVGMTWVLPNGEILKLGPAAFPGAGAIGLSNNMGPEIFGMFINADGMFGVCTEVTVKLFPESETIAASEAIITSAGMGETALRDCVNVIYDMAQEDLMDMVYKTHQATLLLTISAQTGAKVEDLIPIAPPDNLLVYLAGYDAEELAIKTRICEELLQKHNLMVLDLTMFGEEMKQLVTTASFKEALGIKANNYGAYRGSFQFTAALINMDEIPPIGDNYKKLLVKYWKTSDPTRTIEMAMSGTTMQGPLPLGRGTGFEIDFWVDPGNPEEVKRHTKLVHKTQKLIIDHGGTLFRNSFGAGEYHLPRFPIYWSVLKRAKAAFDPANLMHPDVVPVTDDYV